MAAALSLAHPTFKLAGTLGSKLRSDVKAVSPATLASTCVRQTVAPASRRAVTCSAGSSNCAEEAAKPRREAPVLRELRSIDSLWPETDETSYLEEVLTMVNQQEVASALAEALGEMGAAADVDVDSLARLSIHFLQRQYQGKESCARDALFAHLLGRDYDADIAFEVHYSFNQYVEEKSKALCQEMIDAWMS